MTDRQIQAVAEAINRLDNYIRNTDPPEDIYQAFDTLQNAIEASDAKYVPMLVEALRKIAEARHPTSNGDVFASYSELRQYACEALAQIEELRR